MYKSILSFMVLISNIAISQTDTHRNFTHGYIVLLNGDTLKGNIAMLSAEESCDRVEYKKQSTDTVAIFKASDLQMYKRENAIYSGRIISDKKWGFVKLVEKGKVNVYQYSYEFNKASLKGLGGSGKPDQSGPVEIKHESRPTDVKYDYYLEKTGGDFKKISHLNIRGELWNFFKEDDEMVKKVKNSKIEYDEIPGLIHEYNGQH